jgi:hypothetical protein
MTSITLTQCMRCLPAAAACIHACLQLPPDGGSWHDELVVRQVMRRLVGQLVVEEALLLLEGVEVGRQALEAEGRGSKPSSNHWALW